VVNFDFNGAQGPLGLFDFTQFHRPPEFPGRSFPKGFRQEFQYGPCYLIAELSN
jgi:hypothetical protein